VAVTDLTLATKSLYRSQLKNEGSAYEFSTQSSLIHHPHHSTRLSKISCKYLGSEEQQHRNLSYGILSVSDEHFTADYRRSSVNHLTKKPTSQLRPLFRFSLPLSFSLSTARLSTFYDPGLYHLQTRLFQATALQLWHPSVTRVSALAMVV